MLSSTGGAHCTSAAHHTRNPASSSSSSSTSTSPSPSPFSPPNPRAKTMEEVWKDINLSSLHDHPSRDQDISEIPRAHHRACFRGLTLQDFLARPFSKDRPPSVASLDHSTGGPGHDSGLFCSQVAPPPLPATVLSLSGPEFQYLESSDPVRPLSHLHTHPVSNVSPFSGPYEELDLSSGLPSFGKKRFPESDGGCGDRRHKRMIKNRESAARSRARKQAYTNELELEVAHLMEENARLKKQQEQLCLDAAAQLPKKHTLQRTSTAPF